MRSFADPELRRAHLDATRLTIAQGKELLELVEARYEGSLSDRKERRYERLVGNLADDSDTVRAVAEGTGGGGRSRRRKANGPAST